MTSKGSPETHRPEHCRIISAFFGRDPKSPDIGGGKKLPRFLLKVTIRGVLGPVLVVMSLENSVLDVIKAVIEIYTKTGRRPPLAGADPRRFELHYSEFSFESLNPNEQLVNLGSRNFFLCPGQDGGAGGTCSDDALETTALGPLPWLFLMEILL